MDLSTVIKELGRIKHNCMCITFKDCVQGNCPYHGDKYDEPDKCYDDETGEEFLGTHGCMFDDMYMSRPIDWQIPEEID